MVLSSGAGTLQPPGSKVIVQAIAEVLMMAIVPSRVQAFREPNDGFVCAQTLPRRGTTLRFPYASNAGNQ
jgi:hypothetical protein